MDEIDGELSGAQWRRSPSSSGSGPAIEIAMLTHGRVALRDSGEPDGPTLVFTPEEWSAFVAGVNDGEFDRPRS